MNNVDPVQAAGQQLASAAVSLPPELRAQDRETIQAVKAVNAAELFGQNSELTFVMDRHTHRPIIRIVDRNTKEVIMQLPPEYVLQMAEEQMKKEAQEA